MEFEKLISISGQGSLFKIISRTGFGLIAESLEDQKRMPVYQSQNVSSLEDISIYTKEGDVALKEVFLKIYEKEGGKECIDAKEDNDKLKRYFEEILPDFDDERVYVSDMKKVFKWYNQLVKQNLLDPEALKPKEETAEAEGEENKEEAETVKGEEKKEKKEKKDTKKTIKTAAPKVAKSTGAVKNAPAKKVQTVRKAGGS